MSPRRILHLIEDIGAWAKTMASVRWQQQPGQGQDHLHQGVRRKDQQLVQRLHPKRMKLRVKACIEETPSTKTIRLERLDGPLPPFRPGQYINLFVTINSVRTSRPYSISSTPEEPYLDLTVREKAGGFVSPYLLHQIQPGELLESSGPQGQFRYEPLIDSQRLVLLAGGSGITPFMSMIRDGVRQGFPVAMDLLYGSRTESDVLFGEELDELARKHDRFRYALVISEPSSGYSGPRGFLEAQRISDLIGDPVGLTFLLCGPSQMIEHCLQALERLEVPRYKIRTESFGTPSSITSYPGWPEGIDGDQSFTVVVEDFGKIEALAKEPLMVSLERAGFWVPAACRTGACSICRAQILEGEVFMPHEMKLREADRKGKYSHLCLTYPISDVRIKNSDVRR